VLKEKRPRGEGLSDAEKCLRAGQPCTAFPERRCGAASIHLPASCRAIVHFASRRAMISRAWGGVVRLLWREGWFRLADLLLPKASQLFEAGRLGEKSAANLERRLKRRRQPAAPASLWIRIRLVGRRLPGCWQSIFDLGCAVRLDRRADCGAGNRPKIARAIPFFRRRRRRSCWIS